LVAWFGKGLVSPPTAVIENFAQVENVRLPIGARTGQELKSFIIKSVGVVDDFARIYVNNTQVYSTDEPSGPFELITWDGEKDGEKQKYVGRFEVDRAKPTKPEVEVRKWLRQGTNWIMVELENSRWGACSMTFELRANGSQLEGSPYFIPQRDLIDAKLSNPN